MERWKVEKGSSERKIIYEEYAQKHKMKTLNIEAIESKLVDTIFNRKIIYEQVVSSTNIIAKEIALKGYPEGTIVIAETQIAGRGRLGRKWESPSGTGIWLSLILRPDIMPVQAPFITLITALSITKALNEVMGLSPGIKWPNDIIYNNLKVCGILTEMDAQTDKVNFVIVGIGINVNNDLEDFQTDIRYKATSLKEVKGKRVSREKLIIGVLKSFEQIYDKALSCGIDERFKRRILDEYIKYSITIGNRVKVIGIKGEKEGRAVDVTGEGELVIITSDGKEEIINSGEVSVRGINGYI